MRFPWLQIDCDFIDARSSELGALLGITRREAVGLALDLWKWCLSRSPSDRPPDGILSGSAPVPVLASAVSWPDPQQFLSALVEVGLVEVIPQGLRIKGLDRYVSTWKKNRRRPERNRSGTAAAPPPKPERKTQTHTYMKKQSPTETAAGADLPDATEHVVPVEQPAPPAPGSADAPAQPAAKASHLPGLEPPPPAAKPTRADHDWVRAAAERRRTAAPPDAPVESSLRRDQWAKLGEALKAHGKLVLDAAFGLYLADDYARGQGFPLGLFVAQWPEWVAKAQAAANEARRPTRRAGASTWRMDTTPSDFSRLPEGGIDLGETEAGT